MNKAVGKPEQAQTLAEDMYHVLEVIADENGFTLRELVERGVEILTDLTTNSNIPSKKS